MKLGARELRKSIPNETDLAEIKRRKIYIICDNVLDTYNVGSIFRLADAVAAKYVYLCGQMETPPYHRISKAAVGTEKWVPWGYFASASEAINNLRGKFSLRSNNKQSLLFSLRSNNKQSLLFSLRSNNNTSHSSYSSSRRREVSLKVIAIEQAEGGRDFREVDYKEPIAFVVGNETDGVSKEALAMADEIVEIPMWGVNRSLNVMVSLAIVLYRVI